MARATSTTLLARGVTAKEALRALWEEVASLLPEQTAPGVRVVVQASAEQDGSGFVAEARLGIVAAPHDSGG